VFFVYLFALIVFSVIYVLFLFLQYFDTVGWIL